jgi:hypothetical protein
MLGDYRVEIEDCGSERVVLSIPALRLIVMGRTLSEARNWPGPRSPFVGRTVARPPGGRSHAQRTSPRRPPRCRCPALHTRHEP